MIETSVTVKEIITAIVVTGIVPAIWLSLTKVIRFLGRKPKMAYSVCGILSCALIVAVLASGKSVGLSHILGALFWIILFAIAFKSVRK